MTIVRQLKQIFYREQIVVSLLFRFLFRSVICDMKEIGDRLYGENATDPARETRGVSEAIAQNSGDLCSGAPWAG